MDELEGLLEVERACKEAPHWSEDAWRSMLQGTTGGLRWHNVLIAEQDGVVNGFVVSSGVGEVAELESVAVLPAFRSQGLGRALCVAAMAQETERGAAIMELEVRAASYLPRRLYASLGFAAQGVRKAYYRDPVDDAVLMSMTLRTQENQTRKV